MYILIDETVRRDGDTRRLNVTASARVRGSVDCQCEDLRRLSVYRLA